MAVTVHIPKVGMTMEEGVLARWIVPDGTAITRGQPLFEMETEKVEIEVEADGEGVLKHLVEAGTTLKPGGIVGAILAAGESEVPKDIVARATEQWTQPPGGATAAPPATPAPVPAPPPAATAAAAPTARPSRESGERVLATPVARRMAAEHGLDLSPLTGTGPNGRITEDDVRRHLESRAATPAAPTAAAPAAPAGRETIPYSGRRRTIGERMHQSLQTMAQLTLTSEVRVDEAMDMLHGLNREWRSERVVVTLTAVIVRACGLALREYPRLNSRLDGDKIVVEADVNVGFAVNLEEGLMVPVVRGVDGKSLKEVAKAIAEVNDRARDDKLSVDDMTGGTFTVTSLEGLAIDAFTPVINPPQAAILGVGRIREVPVIEGGRVERGQVTTLSLTMDHRVVDGEPASRFLTRVGELLGRPYMLM